MLRDDNNFLIKNLTDFGLSEKEARVYLALLELEVASVAEMAKKAGINRSSTYVVLESLKKKGFVGISKDKNIIQYVASSPDTLLKIANELEEKQKKIRNNLEEIVPDLKSLHKDTKKKPTVRIYEGKEALKSIYYNIDFLKTSSDVKDFQVYEDPAEYLELLPGFIAHDVKERKRLKLKMYAIFPDSKESREAIRQYRSLGSEDEFITIPKEKFKLSKRFSNLTISGSEVSFASLKEEICISIDKKEISDMLSNIFDLAWEEAKRLNTNKN